MEIAVTGEGPADYGKEIYKDGIRKWEWGAAGIYIKRIAKEQNKEVTLHAIPRKNVDAIKLQRRQLQGLDGKAVPARKFAICMQKQGYSYGIYYCDADRGSGDKNSDENVARKRFNSVYESVRKGLEGEINYAIPMVSLRMIENWVVADTKAFEECFGKCPEIPNKPELLWGDKNNPKSDYPKHYLQRIVRSMGKKYETINVSSELYCEIVEQQDLNEVAKKCYISFRKFYEDFSNMLAQEGVKEMGAWNTE